MIPGFMPFWNTLRVSSLILNTVSAVLSTLVASVDFAIVLVAQQKLSSVLTQEGSVIATSGLQFYISFGTAPWMGLVAVAVLWTAVIIGGVLLCDCCFGRIKWNNHKFEAVEQGETTAPLTPDGKKAVARWYACCYGLRPGKQRKPPNNLTRTAPLDEEKKGWLLRNG